MQKKIFLVSILLIVAITIWGAVTTYKKQKLQATDAINLAQCIANSGAKFYGAFWCPHCQQQKKWFGSIAAKKLPYTECSTPDGSAQTEECKALGIEGYPTWIFGNGEKYSGELTPLELSEKTSCPISETLKQIKK